MGGAFDAAGTGPAAVLPAAFASPQTTGTLRWATAGYMSAPDDAPANTAWQPRLLADVELAQNAADAIGLGGRLALGLAEIGLADADGALADLDRWNTADGRAATVTVIPVEDAAASDAGTPLAGRSLGLRLNLLTGAAEIARTDPIRAFRGIVQRVDRDGALTGVLRLSDVTERLATPLQPTKYAAGVPVAGVTLAGAVLEALEGKPQPVTLGQCFNIAPVYLGDHPVLGTAQPVYQVHWRGVQAVDVVRVRGVPQTLVGGVPTVGQARILPEQGLIVLGGSADGPVTADVRGDNSGGYVASLPTVLRRMLEGLGPQLGAADFDGTAFAFAEVDLPGTVGFHQGAEETTAADAAELLAAHCGAVLAGGRGGRLRLFDPLANGAAQFTLPDAWILDCRPVPLPATLRPLSARVAIGWRKNWSPLTDIAGSVPAGDREALRNAESGPVRIFSSAIAARVAQQKDLTYRSLYATAADATARAQKWRAFLEAGPRMFEVTTDRYLHQIECGDMGRIFYPAWGLDAGAHVTVVGWSERIAERRLVLTVVTQPEA